MKKLFLLVGLVVFLAPSLVNANEDEEEQTKINQKLIEEQEGIIGRKLDQSEKSCVFFGYKPSECLRGSSANIFVQNKEKWKAYYRDLKNNPPKACLSNEEILKIVKKCKISLKDEKLLIEHPNIDSPFFGEATLRSIMNQELGCKRGPTFAVEEDKRSYKCKRIDSKIDCFERTQMKFKNKKNCKKVTPKDYGVVRYFPKQYEELAISLGCGIERKDVDDCVRRHLPSIIESGPITMEQVDLIKQEWGLMDEIVFAIEEMNRANSQSNEPSQEEQEQARSEEGYYTEQSNGEWVWVDTRSGYEQFTDKWCIGCSPLKVYWINRSAKKYFQGGYLSGYEKFILRGTNFNKVIKSYK